MTVELTAALQHELDHMAAERGLSVNELALRAIESLVADQRDLDAAMKRSDADIAAGRTLEHDEVVARIDKLLSAQRSSSGPTAQPPIWKGSSFTYAAKVPRCPTSSFMRSSPKQSSFGQFATPREADQNDIH